MLNAIPATTEGFLKLMFQPGEVFEIRALDCGGSDKKMIGVYDDPHEAATDAAELADNLGASLYVGINPVNKDSVYAKSKRLNKYRPSAHALSAESVLIRKHILVDIDSAHPSNACATNAEKADAFKAREIISAYLTNTLGVEGICVDSGNGAHIILDFLGEVENDAVRGFLSHLHGQISDVIEGPLVDLKVSDLPRITRLPGCPNRKGADTPERPHRLAQVMSGAFERKAITGDQVIELAREEGYLPPEERPQKPLSAPGEEVTEGDVRQFMGEYRQYFAPGGESRKSDGHYFYLQRCPLKGKPHTGAGGGSTCTALRLSPEGEVSYHCFGCLDKGRRMSFQKLVKLLVEKTGKRPSNPQFERRTEAAIDFE